MLLSNPVDLCTTYCSTCFLVWIGARYGSLAQPFTTAGEELDDLDRDLSDLSEVYLVVQANLAVGQR